MGRIIRIDVDDKYGMTQSVAGGVPTRSGGTINCDVRTGLFPALAGKPLICSTLLIFVHK